MTPLNKLYAERDRLRSERAKAERDLEKVYSALEKNRIAINAATINHRGATGGSHASAPVDTTERSDIPEFLRLVTVDQ